MTRKVIFKTVARLEFDEAVAWYERQRPGLGASFETEVNSILAQIKDHPGRFPRVTPRVRKARLRNFPYYSLYFTETPQHIGVVAVYHAKRDPAVLRQRLE